MRKKITIVFIILSSIFCSCEDRTTKSPSKNGIIPQELLVLNIPDSVVNGENIMGSIKYNREIDSLTPKDISSRYVFLHLTTSSKQKNLSIETIKTENRMVFEDTVGNGIFDFDIVFEKSGNQILNGVIEDIIILNEQIEEQDKVRIITKETSVSKNIFVKD